jgi:LysR family hydrogen peroxide-inducible transcriptional activator
MALPSLRQLGYLVALAEHLNFHAAAQAQFVTQSTLSAGIKELESVLGVQLVERDKRRVRLTAAGEEVAARARELLAAAADLVQAARSGAAPLTGVLRLGAIPTLAPFLLPQVLPPLRRAHPALKLQLREELTEPLLERLRSGALDAALIALPYDTGDLHVRNLFRDELWLVAREDDPVAQAKSVAARRLDPRTLLLLEEGHCLREHAIAACRPRRGAHAPAVEATSLYTLIQMVESGFGATLVPEIALRSGLLAGSRLVARPFDPPAPARTIALAARRSSSRLRDVELLAQFILEQRRSTKHGGVAAPRRTTIRES